MINTESRLKPAKEAAASLIETTGDYDHIAVITYSSNATVISPTNSTEDTLVQATN